MNQEAEKSLKALITDALNNAKAQKCKTCVIGDVDDLAFRVLKQRKNSKEAHDLALLIVSRNRLTNS
jgi:hypothetical protein